jgi:NTP pyrophosphatase (non-canonical NTP hydrolase)
MDINTYQSLALRTAAGNPNLNAVPVDALHAAIGLATEAGEALDIIKKCIFYGKPFGDAERVHFSEECQDSLWYVALGLSAIDVKMSDAALANIRKLKARYPERFDSVRALIRDLDKELEALNGN